MDARSGASRERVEAEPLPRDFPVPELGKLSACVVGQEVPSDGSAAAGIQSLQLW